MADHTYQASPAQLTTAKAGRLSIVFTPGKGLMPRGAPHRDTCLPPPYAPGDVLLLQEEWSEHHTHVPGFPIHYRADLPSHPSDAMTANHAFGLMRWQPASAMKPEHCRHRLRVQSCEPVRLADVSEADALAAGYDEETRTLGLAAMADLTPDEQRARMDEFLSARLKGAAGCLRAAFPGVEWIWKVSVSQ